MNQIELDLIRQTIRQTTKTNKQTDNHTEYDKIKQNQKDKQPDNLTEAHGIKNTLKQNQGIRQTMGRALGQNQENRPRQTSDTKETICRQIQEHPQEGIGQNLTEIDRLR